MQKTDVLCLGRERRPYYIVAPAYTRYSAGVKVLHRLCHLLNVQGQSAFLVTCGVNPDLVTPVLNDPIVDAHYRQKRTPIVVYPERLAGNPLHGRCVARYLLNYPGLLGGPRAFEASDLLVWYTENMKKDCQCDGPVLSISAVDAEVFIPPPEGTRREGSCFYAGKFRRRSGEELSPITQNSVEIPSGGDEEESQDELAALFQRSEVFYCYEASSLAVEAVLCGCPTVLLPSRFFSKPVIDPMNWTGVAWGNSPEEVERARRTVGQARERYELWQQQTLDQLEGFVEWTQRKARQTAYVEKIRLVDPYASRRSVRRRFERGCRNAWRALLGRSPRS